MKKKVLLLLASLALVTTLAVNGTFASDVAEVIDSFVEFVTDVFRSPEINTDQLDVKLVTRDRNGELTDTNKPMLYPAHYAGNTLKLKTKKITRFNDAFMVWETNDISGVAEQFVSVQNQANEHVYFLIAIAVKNDENAKAVLRSNISPASGAYEEYTRDITIKGSPYTMSVYLYKNELAAPTQANSVVESPAICVQMALVKEAGNEQLSDLGSDFLQIKVVAIDAEEFKNAADSDMDYKKALTMAIDLEKFNPFE